MANGLIGETTAGHVGVLLEESFGMHAVGESHEGRMDAVAEQPLHVLARSGYPFTADRQTEVLLLATPWGAVLGRNAHSRGGGSVAETTLNGFSREAELRTTLDREPAAVRQLRSPDYIVDRYRTALSMVAAGMGVMAVPAIIAPAVPRGAKLLDLVHQTCSERWVYLFGRRPARRQRSKILLPRSSSGSAKSVE